MSCVAALQPCVFLYARRRESGVDAVVCGDAGVRTKRRS